MKYNVLMERNIGGWVMLTVGDRHKWSKRTALKHLKDVKNSEYFTKRHTDFRIVED